VRPKHGITTSEDDVPRAVSQGHTGPDEMSRAWKLKSADCGQSDGAGSTYLIEGPLLFAFDNEEVEDEECGVSLRY
jgi:hypothetical protein